MTSVLINAGAPHVEDLALELGKVSWVKLCTPLERRCITDSDWLSGEVSHFSSSTYTTSFEPLLLLPTARELK